jgi:hypothetical protein
MLDKADKSYELAAAAPQGLPSDLRLDRGDPLDGWMPVEEEIVIFMTNGRECRHCRHLRDALGHAPRLCLHVRKRGSLLVVTHACDLHEPGEVLIAQRVTDISDQVHYQLASALPEATNVPMFRPAAGLVVLFRRGGKYHLRAMGAREGFGPPSECLIEAYEISK